MKIAILADSHDNYLNLEMAVEMANKNKCEILLFAGDLISPSGIFVLEKFNGKVKFIWGNNEGEKVKITQLTAKSKNVELCGDYFEDEIDKIKIFMNHYPRFAELASKSGDFDLCIHGHTHEYRVENIGKTILLNPGSVCNNFEQKGQFVIFDTKTKQVEKIILD